jgi:hypothetical protein
MATLKSIYLDSNNGINGKLAEAFELGRRFILPQYDDVVLEDAVDISPISPMFTIKNSGSNASILSGYTVKYLNSGNAEEKIVSSPIVAGSTFDVTVAPGESLTNKSITYSSPRPASYVSLLNGIQSAANAGKSIFTVSVATSDNPTYLRLKGNYMKAYFAGIYNALGKEGIFNTYEISLSLDTSQVATTSIIFSFTFTYS